MSGGGVRATSAVVAALSVVLYWLLCPPNLLVARDAQTVAGLHVLITGASQGIGKALVFEYARRGAAKIVIASRSQDKLAAVRTAVISLYPNTTVEVVAADLSTQAQSYALLATALDRLDNSLDVLILNHITNARYGTWLGDQAAAPEGHAMLADIFAVNCFSYIWLASAAVEPLKRSRTGGHIGVVSSLAAHVGVPKTAAYGATKHALQGFFSAFRVELGLLDIKGLGVTIAAIGATDTEGAQQVKAAMHSSLVWDHPSQAAEAILLGVAAKKRDVYHPHPVVFPAIQIYRFFPELLERVLCAVVGT